MGTHFLGHCAGFGSAVMFLRWSMPLLAKAKSLLRNLLFTRRVEEDLDREVRSHFQMLVDERIRAGMGRKEAERAARMELGGAEQVKEQVREEQLGHWLHSVVSDCRFGLRQLAKNRGFTLTVVLTLALSVGANTAIFSLVNALLLKSLPYAHPERMGTIYTRIAGSSEASDKRSEEHTSELQSRLHLVCRLLLEKKKNKILTRRCAKGLTHHDTSTFYVELPKNRNHINTFYAV